MKALSAFDSICTHHSHPCLVRSHRNDVRGVRMPTTSCKLFEVGEAQATAVEDRETRWRADRMNPVARIGISYRRGRSSRLQALAVFRRANSGYRSDSGCHGPPKSGSSFFSDASSNGKSSWIVRHTSG